MNLSILFDKNVVLRLYLIQLRLKSRLSSNLYEILGVSQAASLKEIKSAYYKKCKENHPDSNKGDPRSHDKFVKIQRAYDVLSQVSTRKAYDNYILKPNPKALQYRGSAQHNSPNYSTSQQYYTQQRMSNYQYEEFERYMRNQQKYANSEPKSQPQMSFDSPLRVMMFIIVSLAIFEMYTVSLIYKRDMNQLHADSHMGYSPLNRHAMGELRRQVHLALDDSEMEEKISKAKEIEKNGFSSEVINK